MIQFKEFPKMGRFSRDFIITEKIDGTNGSVFIQHIALEPLIDDGRGNMINIPDPHIISTSEDGFYTMRVGSRTKWITPFDDNYGFGNWCKTNANDLFKLGEGHHFGEWWGSGIQRGYGLQKGEKRFSLFNTVRWNTEEKPECCHVVPILTSGNFNTININVENSLNTLKENGSIAAPGFMKPEGIVIFHLAANIGFKKTIEKDESPKSLQK